jgi:hypothetical protein
MNLVVDFNKGKLTRAKTNKMKKIIIFELWEYGAYCKVRSICL